MKGPPPAFAEANPLDRTFPTEWKNTYFRRTATNNEEGRVSYICPLCREAFSHEDIDLLQGDHVWPWSFFGETSWENYRLICSKCNVLRSNKLDSIIRQTLGQGEFRELVISFLTAHLADWDSDTILRDLLSCKDGR
jgi:hypothetical protein